MLTLRLQRAGKKNKPEFRIILAEKTAAANKKFQEILGNYNPRTKQFSVKNPERLNYWIAQHVEISATLHNILVSNKMLELPKKRAFSVPTKVKAKNAEKEAKAKADAEAAAATPPAAEEPTAEEAPVTEETPAETSAEPATVAVDSEEKQAE